MDDFIDFPDKKGIINNILCNSSEITYNDRVVLVAIAKNEDNYIEEWINYYLKLGVDDIFIYENDWVYNIDNPHVHCIPFNGTYKQLEAYNHFLEKYSNNYGWAAFFDVDEFLCLKQHTTIKDWLFHYSTYNAIGVNWRVFGDNGLTTVENNNYSVIDRFTKASKKLDNHIKTILNLNKVISDIKFTRDPHHVNVALTSDFTINTKRTGFIRGPYNKNYIDPNVQLNHYYCKTLSEFIENKNRKGSATCAKNNNKLQNFDVYNLNEISDFTAYNFFHDIKD